MKAERYIASLKKRMKVPMPNVIPQNNQKMGGVDRLDQKFAQYQPPIREKKVVLPKCQLPDYSMCKQRLDFCKRGRLQR